MKKLVLIPAVLALSISIPAYAGEPKTSYDSLGYQFSACAALWQVKSDLHSSVGKPNQAKNASNVANGWLISAMFLLSIEAAEATGKEAKIVGRYSDIVDNYVDVEKVAFMAALESDDTEYVEATVGLCKALAPSQEEMVAAIRADMLTQD